MPWSTPDRPDHQEDYVRAHLASPTPQRSLSDDDDDDDDRRNSTDAAVSGLTDLCLKFDDSDSDTDLEDSDVDTLVPGVVRIRSNTLPSNSARGVHIRISGDDDDESSSVPSYKYKVAEEKAVLQAVSSWKSTHITGSKRGGDGDVTPTVSGSSVHSTERGLSEPEWPSSASVPEDPELETCKSTPFHRVYHDDPDMADADGESIIAKAMMQAIRLRRKYLDLSGQRVPEHVQNTLRQVRHRKLSTTVGGVSRFANTPARTEQAPHRTRSISSSHSAGHHHHSFPTLTASCLTRPAYMQCYSAACRNQASNGESGGSQQPCLSPTCPQGRISFVMKEGVVQVLDKRQTTATTKGLNSSAHPLPFAQSSPDHPPMTLFHFVDRSTWFCDMSMLGSLLIDGASKSFAFRRIEYLKKKFQMHQMLNEADELAAQKMVPHRDFYNTRKVDTHVHLSSCMNLKHLLRFIKKKMKVEPDVKVCVRDGKVLTLKEVFDSLGVTPYDLSIDTLDMHADRSLFQRFDKFNLKYNPVGESRLREIFLKSSNYIDGRYYAELCKEVFSDLADSKYQYAEYRVSIYGRNKAEWSVLANWFCKQKMKSSHVAWLIQVPRLFNIYAKAGMLKNFQEMLANVFLPIFEATLDPTKDPQLTTFLENIAGFDSVDDESKPDGAPKFSKPTPDKWTKAKNPAYSEYIYYFYANISVLNQMRASRGLNTFTFRPHSGEAGPIEHLMASFLTADGIAHGIVLRKAPVLQYLYYLTQMGIYMSPLSNNSLFLDISKNPFKQYFDAGLNVSLSTDDPLQFHLSKEPLIEEFSIARQIWKLSSTDIAELCRNSVRQSGFPDDFKVKWLGKNWMKLGTGNDIKLSNLPDIRLAFRYETLQNELRVLTELCLG